MTDQQSPTPELTFPKDAKAQANGEPTRRETTRPWFKKKRFLMLLTLILLMVAFWAAVGGGDTGTSHSARSGTQPSVTSAAKAPAVAVGIGTHARDGKFDFVVTGVERPGKTLAGKVGRTLTAQGEFVIVRVSVTNIGKEAQAPNCACQFLSNDKGQHFRPSSAILSTKEALKFVQLIEPAETVNGVLVLFDVAPGSKVVDIELHDSPLSKGVNVKLS